MSLTALWAFAAWVTLREGVNLLGATTIDGNVAEPSEPLLLELQRERRITVARLGNSSAYSRQELQEQRARTDKARAEFESSADSGSVRFAASKALQDRIRATFLQLDGLSATRSAIDGGQLARARAESAYNDVADSFAQMYESVATLDDEDIAKDGRLLSTMNQGREMLAREDALLAGVFAAGRFTEADHARYATLVGAQRYILDHTASGLSGEDRAAYERWTKSRAVTAMRNLEDLLMQSRQVDRPLTVTDAQWRSVAEPALANLQKVILDGGDRLVERATPMAIGVVVRLVLAGLLGLFAVVASIILSITTARALVQQLEKLRDAALELAHERLPSVVNKLGRGEKVDVAVEAPPLQFGDDVIGQVGQAFNTVQETAIRTAVEEAELRQSIRDILLSLARRTQSLVHRQLTLLDVMERREHDEAELRDLFRVDHLATRMRRNAENLIVLSGASPARAWRRAVPMVDVVRGALAEVEDYTRVSVLPMGDVELSGRAVGDVIHLLAELVENAVSFSPPYTMVQVSGQIVANGYAIEIEDRGLGMTEEDLAATNERIADPPEFNLSSTARLGLYVVSKLAERHDIRVMLKSSPYGGTTAIALLPHELIGDSMNQQSPSEPKSVEQLAGEGGFGTARDDQGGASFPVSRIALVGGREPSVQAVRTIPDSTASAAPESATGPETDSVTGPVPGPATGPVPGLRPESAQESREPQGSPPEPSFTPSGLPFRVPQASIAPSLRDDAPVSTPADALEEEDDDRSPEEIRKIMGSFQSGTRRGRSEASKLVGDDTGPFDDRPSA
ncbi:nitrate- and nitrite sensing domain-containing protein [Microtetraspora sp. NBRC 16547]|uniref:sensor histidine kinase n=1 Tax=Microtetraspora sp. NBRC 16547 TaxID=3030993 RepID=UPI0025530F2F|nr:nitrate- and nitrite sensing domain-containing protein [Microtetraspora sp. NBRC 16547]